MTVHPVELPTSGSRLIMGLNPPFGIQVVLANKFIETSLCSSVDWRYAAEQFVKRLPDKGISFVNDVATLNIFNADSECKLLKLTLDGVDLMGERLAQEEVAVGNL
ncbi:hypothetical protein K2173_020512 [Erythroxylum novogranatense]|uniref:DM2 domain-containing protein n=1 Tax=Erythroxylum novogranatense TaxID=1862640 RepID=A0AAV8TGQ8_9ROSI|nr:hypothetical protein K2173_020512 [Erythroxylum novogranatense]